MTLMMPSKPSFGTFHSHSHSQSGFTLIELMVALVLGLLISAAALQLFFNSSNNLRIQEGADDVQDAAVFNLSYVEKEIAMANLGAYQPMTQDSAWTGIIMTSSIGEANKVGNLRGIKDATEAIVTKTAVAASNAKIASDQLTIQYRAPFRMSDCEGRNIDKDTMVVERFFTRKDTMGGTNDIVLACDAGSYELAGDADAAQATTNATLINMGDNGSVLVNRVDYFTVKLGVQAKNGLVYLTPTEYMKRNTAKESGYEYEAPLVAVQIGVLTRGTAPIAGEPQKKFTVLGSEIEIKNTDKNYVRRVYESTIRLRNGRT